MDYDRWIKFGIIVLCFTNSIFSKDGFVMGKKDANLLRAAMGLTVIADFFMVVYGLNIQGIGVFCLVQAVHNYRFTNIQRVKVQVIFSGLVFIAVYLISGFNLLLSLGGAYVIFSLYGLGGAVIAFREFPKPNNIMLLIGMILFALCDVFVLLYNIPAGALVFGKETILSLIWLCYLPGQVLISSSSKKVKSYD